MGLTGLTVEPGDSAALADALRRITTDAALRTRLGVQAREEGLLEAIGAIVLKDKELYPGDTVAEAIGEANNEIAGFGQTRTTAVIAVGQTIWPVARSRA